MERLFSITPELHDPDERAFLYSDLEKQKHDNPEGYQKAFAFWRNSILNACKYGLLSPESASNMNSSNSADMSYELDKSLDNSGGNTAASVLCIDNSRLETQFSYKGDTPTGLNLIINDLEHKGDLELFESFFSSNAMKIIEWFVTKLPLASMIWGLGTETKHKSWMVVLPLVKEKSMKVLNYHHESVIYPLTDNLMSMSEFRSKFISVLIPLLNFAQPTSTITKMAIVDSRIIVHYLENNGYLATLPSTEKCEDGGNDLLLKFISKTAVTERMITEADKGAYQVLKTKREIERQIEMLESRITQLDKQIKDAILRKQKPLALSKLRLKKYIESEILPKRVSAFEKIELVVGQLQQTSSDIQLFKALEAGTMSLRGLNAQVNTGCIDQAFDDWADEALKAKELDDILNDGYALVKSDLPASIVGEDVDQELEDELDALIAADRKQTLDDEMLSKALDSVKITSDTLKESSPISSDNMKEIHAIDTTAEPNTNTNYGDAIDEEEKEHNEQGVPMLAE